VSGCKSNYIQKEFREKLHRQTDCSDAAFLNPTLSDIQSNRHSPCPESFRFPAKKLMPHSELADLPVSIKMQLKNKLRDNVTNICNKRLRLTTEWCAPRTDGLQARQKIEKPHRCGCEKNVHAMKQKKK
jgi:hypothetical protein